VIRSNAYSREEFDTTTTLTVLVLVEYSCYSHLRLLLLLLVLLLLPIGYHNFVMISIVLLLLLPLLLIRVVDSYLHSSSMDYQIMPLCLIKTLLMIYATYYDYYVYSSSPVSYATDVFMPWISPWWCWEYVSFRLATTQVESTNLRSFKNVRVHSGDLKRLASLLGYYYYYCCCWGG